MKISELVAILEQRKEQYGDVDVRVWDSEEYCMNSNISVNDFLSDYGGYGIGRVEHYIGINLEDE